MQKTPIKSQSGGIVGHMPTEQAEALPRSRQVRNKRGRLCFVTVEPPSPVCVALIQAGKPSRYGMDFQQPLANVGRRVHALVGVRGS